MSVPLRSAASLLALLAISCAGALPAHAAPEGRAWTDPPARGAALTPEPDAAHTASPATSAPRAADSKSRAADVEPHAAESERDAASSEPKATASKRRVAVAKPRIAAVRSRSVAVHPGPVSRPARPAPSRIAAPARSRMSNPRSPRFGFLPPPPPPGMVYAVSRVQRIRQAEAAGYLVMRRSTFAAPDGRLVYDYRPYDADDE